MHQQKIEIRDISDPVKLYHWILGRMAAEDLAPASLDLDTRCDLFLDILNRCEPLTFAYVTRNSLGRLRDLDPSVQGHHVLRSKRVLRFLGALGHRIERSKTPLTLSFDDLVVFAAYAWAPDCSQICVQPQKGYYRLVAGRETVRKHRVYFDVTVRPKHDMHWLMRFLNG